MASDNPAASPGKACRGGHGRETSQHRPPGRPPSGAYFSTPSGVHTGMHFAERCRPARAQPAARNDQIRATQPEIINEPLTRQIET